MWVNVIVCMCVGECGCVNKCVKERGCVQPRGMSPTVAIIDPIEISPTSQKKAPHASARACVWPTERERERESVCVHVLLKGSMQEVQERARERVCVCVEEASI